MAEEPSKLERLGGKLLRSSERAGLEDLIASELALAMISPPLEKIRHACEALMLLDEDERKRATITGEEVEEAERIYALASTFENVFIDRYEDMYGKVVERSATISWPFAQEEAGKWLGGWADGASCKYYVQDGDRSEYDKIKKISNMLERRYIASRVRVTIDSLNDFKIRFVAYAMPKAANLLKKIIRLVSPDSFTQALEMFKSRRAPSEKAEY
jgi:hypothetical protein